MKGILIAGLLAIATFAVGIWYSGANFLPFKQKRANVPAAEITKTVEPPPLPELTAEEDAASILQKAVAAHGGVEKNDKFQTVRYKGQGYMYIENIKCSFSSDAVFQRPMKYKQSLRVVGTNQVDVTTIFNGEKIWINNGQNIYESSDKRALVGAAQLFQIDGNALGDYCKPPYELTNLGFVSIKGRGAVGIRIAKPEENDVIIYLDRRTHLIAKTKTRGYDIVFKTESDWEEYIISYKEIDGMKYAHRSDTYRNGQIFANAEVTSLTPIARLDDSVFAIP